MNAQEAHRISIEANHLKAQRLTKEAINRTMADKAEALQRLPDEIEMWHRRIAEAAISGEMSTWIMGASGGAGLLLQDLVRKELEKEGYKTSVEWHQFDDDGNGQETLTVSW